MGDNNLLTQPLIPTTSTFITQNNNHHLTSSNFAIFSRFAFIIFIATISIWANHEASKGFTITIINNASNSPAGKRFSLFYVSNDKATRILLHASKIVENILYPHNTYPKKKIQHVILSFSSRNFTQMVIVDYGNNEGEFVVQLSHSIMEEKNFSDAVLAAVKRGMVRVWVYDGNGNAPAGIINGMVEYISGLGYEDVWSERVGFIRGLNQAMRDGWRDRTVDDVKKICGSNSCSSNFLFSL